MNASTATPILATAAFLAIALSPAATAQNYEHTWQAAVGAPPTFHVDGSATGSAPDTEGDAMLNQVEMANGERFYFFYKPIEVRDVTIEGDPARFRVKGGSRSTAGLTGTFAFPTNTSDNNALQDFRSRLVTAMQSQNLNNYADISGNAVDFTFTLKFDTVVKDNDPNRDELGEIVYFERGRGDGNSWLKMRAVDEHGDPLGPWLVVGPSETVQTTPLTTLSSGQTMGATAIDVSRLGVTEFQYLQVSNKVEDEAAYSGGGDTAPDFKIMVVMTDDTQIYELLGGFD